MNLQKYKYNTTSEIETILGTEIDVKWFNKVPNATLWAETVHKAENLQQRGAIVETRSAAGGIPDWGIPDGVHGGGYI